MRTSDLIHMLENILSFQIVLHILFWYFRYLPENSTSTGLLKINYNPAILVLNLIPKDLKPACCRDICTLMLLQLSSPRNGRGLSAHQWMSIIGQRKLGYKDNRIFFSLFKEGNLVVCDNTGRSGQHYAK